MRISVEVANSFVSLIGDHVGNLVRLNQKKLTVVLEYVNRSSRLVSVARRKEIFFQQYRVTVVVISVILASISLTTIADAEQSLKETVVTATRIPVIAEQIGSPVSVIDQTDINRMQYRSLADALRHVPGLHSVPIGGSGHQTSLFVRGSASNHVLVLVDGANSASGTNPGR